MWRQRCLTRHCTQSASSEHNSRAETIQFYVTWRRDLVGNVTPSSHLLPTPRASRALLFAGIFVMATSRDKQIGGPGSLHVPEMPGRVSQSTGLWLLMIPSSALQIAM